MRLGGRHLGTSAARKLAGRQADQGSGRSRRAGRPADAQEARAARRSDGDLAGGKAAANLFKAAVNPPLKSLLAHEDPPLKPLLAAEGSDAVPAGRNTYAPASGAGRQTTVLTAGFPGNPPFSPFCVSFPQTDAHRTAALDERKPSDAETIP